MFGDGDLTLSALKLWSTLEFSRVFSVFADDIRFVINSIYGGKYHDVYESLLRPIYT